MFARVLAEDPPEERAASAQQHLMGTYAALRTHKRHVHQRLSMQQRLEGTQQVRLVVVPAEAVVLLTSSGARLVLHLERSARGRSTLCPLSAGICTRKRAEGPPSHPLSHSDNPFSETSCHRRKTEAFQNSQF